MANVADAPKDSFRPSMLIYDTRYRAITIQVIVLVLVGLFVGWLVHNTIVNLAAKDKDISFAFLFNRAGYDIDQQLIPYTNDSTHGRAAIVGLLNTLLVAVLGCVLATVIGVLVGVLRLSKNWLVSRLMTIYVETLRNVPLVLWIILVFVIFSETAPGPRDFKVIEGQEPKASMMLFDTVAVTNRGTNVPRPLLDRPLGTFDIAGVPVNLSVIVALLIIAASIWANSRLRANAKAVQEATGNRPVTWWKSLLILFGPILALLVALGFRLEYPALAGFNFKGGFSLSHSFTALLLAISLYTSSYIAETVRAGIMAVSRGQSEAALALGLRPGRTMSLVILPQALRVIIPPLISQYLNLTKNTTLGAFVSYMDLKGTLGGITLNQTGRELECMLLLMLTYLILSLIISSVMNTFNAKVRLKER